jgi:phospholipid/cholesterol/gamma-HCH transport system substrate-binding protein
MLNAQGITGSLASITNDIQSGKGSLGRLLYNDSLARSLEGTAANAKITMSTINDAAFGFSENMKALSNNFLLRGYFKKQAKAKEKAAAEDVKNGEAEPDLTEAELAEIEAAADKAHQLIVDRRQKAKAN